MGVIRKMLARGNVLGEVRHSNLFLDMEENIHIHYRDLRIELSRAEFEEICAAFGAQSIELLTVMRERNYEDGKLPNANQDEVRVWTDSKLKAPVKYHPTRVSVEECTDGYHLHLRNYKLLFNREEFEALLAMLREVDLDAPYASSYDDVLELLWANDIDFKHELSAAKDLLRLHVEPHHVIKVKAIVNGLPFKRRSNDPIRYVSDALTIEVLPAPKPAADERPAAGDIVPLTEILEAPTARKDPNLVNTIKLQVVNMLGLADSAGGTSLLNLDFHTWLFDRRKGVVIFPYTQLPTVGPKVVNVAYKRWADYLRSLQMDMLKPKKALYPPERQDHYWNELQSFIAERIAPHRAITRVYAMGSATRKELGVYERPFVHSRWVKIGSDIDLLIETEAGREEELPADWRYVTRASNTCDIYHIGQLAIDGGEKVEKANPYVSVWHHLLDAYVFKPSSSDPDTKDRFLAKFRAQLLYDRDSGKGAGEEQSRQLVEAVSAQYGLHVSTVHAMKVATENAVFRIGSGERTYALKLFKVGGNYSSSRMQEHVEYESRLVAEVARRGIPTAGVIPAADGKLVTHMDGRPAVLFELLEGEVLHRPEYPMAAVAETLAAYHRTQQEQPLDLGRGFTFRDVTELWWPAFERFRGETRDDAEIAGLFERFAELLPVCRAQCEEFLMGDTDGAVHNHGDVTPRNMILDARGRIQLFDFQNAFFGSRLLDVLDGAYEFSLAGKYFDQCDFDRYHRLIAAYGEAAPFDADEQRLLVPSGVLMGILKFIKEVRMARDQTHRDNLRRKRALAVAAHVQALAGGNAEPALPLSRTG